MEILSAYRARLLAVSAVATRAVGGIHIASVPQTTIRPNILLELPEQGQDYSHSGPDGLFDGHLRITCRADSVTSAAELGEEVTLALQDWRGIYYGCRVQMTEHFNTMSGYDSAAKVFTHVSEYTAHFTRVST